MVDNLDEFTSTYNKQRNDIGNSYLGVELDIGERWLQGTEHHPESRELMKKIIDLDFYFGRDRFCFKIGGDGDNGEHLMYLMDIIFEKRDKMAQV